MGLIDYVVQSDKFQAEEATNGFDFPCGVCIHRHGTDMDEPCGTCDHNMLSDSMLWYRLQNKNPQ